MKRYRVTYRQTRDGIHTTKTEIVYADNGLDAIESVKKYYIAEANDTVHVVASARGTESVQVRYYEVGIDADENVHEVILDNFRAEKV